MKRAKKKKPCPCVALEMDENACDGCDKFKGVKKTEKLVRIVFEYKDEWSNGEWRRQECLVRSLQECKKIYGLDKCEHRIIEITEANNG